ncbi:hypothetical protein D3C77_648820 [compost metagenome]
MIKVFLGDHMLPLGVRTGNWSAGLQCRIVAKSKMAAKLEGDDVAYCGIAVVQFHLVRRAIDGGVVVDCIVLVLLGKVSSGQLVSTAR